VEMLATNRGFKVTFGDSIEEKVLFLAQNIKKEVLEGSHKLKKIRTLKKLYKKFAVAFGVKVGMASPAFAATVAVAPQTITPAVILHWGIMLALITVSIGVAISMSMLAIAGIYRMFKRRDEATEWTQTSSRV